MKFISCAGRKKCNEDILSLKCNTNTNTYHSRPWAAWCSAIITSYISVHKYFYRDAFYAVLAPCCTIFNSNLTNGYQIYILIYFTWVLTGLIHSPPGFRETKGRNLFGLLEVRLQRQLQETYSSSERHKVLYQYFQQLWLHYF